MLSPAERGELSAEAELRITEAVHSLVNDKIDRGIDVSRPFRCDSCEQEKSGSGASQYGAYALCNECLLEFTLLLAKGEVDDVAEYMTKRPDETPYVGAHVKQETSSVRPTPKLTEKLMPSNEPV